MTDKIIKLQNGDRFQVTNDEARKIMDVKEDIVFISRLDAWLNKKYIVSISQSSLSNYKKMQ